MIRQKAIKWVDVVKIGRTHLQDATPLTVGQEWSGYMTQLSDALDNTKESMKNLYKRCQAVLQWEQDSITCQILGLRSPTEIARLTNHPFISAPNKFASQGSLTVWFILVRHCEDLRLH